MTQGYPQVLDAALSLPPEQRLDLAELLSLSLSVPEEIAVDMAKRAQMRADALKTSNAGDPQA